MEQQDTFYINLISKYLCGEALPEEIRILEQWVDADPANASLFRQYYRTWEAVENARIGASVNLDNEWDLLKSRIPHPVPLRRDLRFASTSRIPFLLLFRAAAILILLLIPAFFLYRHFTSPAERQLAAGTEMVEQTLPDGTMVTLNAGAVLTYPSSFTGTFRNVSLKGEAWFEVTHDKTRPFIISAGNARIRVVGTSFFVNAGTGNEKKEVILSSGIVRVYYKDDPRNTALLHPGDRAEMKAESGEIVKTVNEDPNFLAWKTKRMVFNNAPLDEVTALLSKVYRTDITLAEERLKDCRITATFDRQSLESVLHVLEATLDLQSRDSGAGIQLYGRGCNPAR